MNDYQTALDNDNAALTDAELDSASGGRPVLRDPISPLIKATANLIEAIWDLF